MELAAGSIDRTATASERACAQANETRQAIPSETLLRDKRMVCIRHAGHDYYLRITRENKLILTK